MVPSEIRPRLVLEPELEVEPEPGAAGDEELLQAVAAASDAVTAARAKYLAGLRAGRDLIAGMTELLLVGEGLKKTRCECG
jgi:hypothetical protein